jgi:heparan-alpha-glucosaminide N-acetyltransferase
MEKGQEIAADGEKVPEQHQHAIDVGHVNHGDGKGEEDVEKERVAVAEEVPKKKSRRVAALDAFRGLTIVVHTPTHRPISAFCFFI